jgi:integrase/recombinase XerD
MSRVKAEIKLTSQGKRLFTTTYDEFQAYNTIRNLREATITSYSTYKILLAKYFLTLNGTIEDFTVDYITDSFIMGFIEYMGNIRHNGTNSINTALRHLRAFLNFSSERGYMKPLKIKLLRVDEPYKEPYSEEEIDILLKKPKMTKNNWLEYRNWVLTNYMFGTGNRIGSIVAILNEDVDLSRGQIYLRHTKNRKVQIIPLTPRLISILREYMSIRKGTSDECLFCNQSGKPLRAQAIVQAIHDYNLERGIRKTSCHLWRHSFALAWLKNGGGVVELQYLLGHSSITQTMKYVNLLKLDVSSIIASFNPLERVNNTREKTMFIEK